MTARAATGYHVVAPDKRGLRLHHWMGRRLRRRSGLVPDAQSHTRRTQSRVGARVGEHQTAGLVIFLASGKTIKLKVDDLYSLQIFAGDTSKALGMLLNVYAQLEQRTFEFRLKPYVEELQKYGIFNFGGATFEPAKGLIVCQGNHYHTGTDKVVRSYGQLRFRSAQASFKEAVSRLWSGGQSVSTLRDGDVLFHLLATKFNLSWND